MPYLQCNLNSNNHVITQICESTHRGSLLFFSPTASMYDWLPNGTSRYLVYRVWQYTVTSQNRTSSRHHTPFKLQLHFGRKRLQQENGLTPSGIDLVPLNLQMRHKSTTEWWRTKYNRTGTPGSRPSLKPLIVPKWPLCLHSAQTSTTESGHHW